MFLNLICLFSPFCKIKAHLCKGATEKTNKQKNQGAMTRSGSEDRVFPSICMSRNRFLWTIRLAGVTEPWFRICTITVNKQQPVLHSLDSWFLSPPPAGGWEIPSYFWILPNSLYRLMSLLPLNKQLIDKWVGSDSSSTRPCGSESEMDISVQIPVENWETRPNHQGPLTVTFTSPPSPPSLKSSRSVYNISWACPTLTPPLASKGPFQKPWWKYGFQAQYK